MLLKIFAVYDSKLAAHFHPFYAPHAAIAKRAFTATVNDRESQIHAHPADFTLMELGTWNDETGEFSNHEKPINHGLAAFYQVKDHGEQPPAALGHEAQVQRGAEGGDPA